MNIGIISDTHDNFDNVERALDELEKRDVDVVCHLGDWVSPATFNLINKWAKKLRVPVKGVLGNNDGEIFKIVDRSAHEWEIELEHHTLRFEADGKALVMYHGTDHRITDALIKSGIYDVVLSGHTHTPKHELIGDTLALNPGTLCGFSAGKKIDEGQLAIYDSSTNKVDLLAFSLV